MPFKSNNPLLKENRQSLRTNQTDAESKLWYYLRNKQLAGLKFFRQYSLGNYIMDFYCSEKRLAIELDGSQHLAQEEYDAERTKYLNEHGIHVLRFWNDQVLQDCDVVLQVISDWLEGR